MCPFGWRRNSLSPNQSEWLSSKEIKVTLADGETVLQPIVPVSLVAALGYSVNWDKNGCDISHPKLGALPVTLSQGCPVVPGFDEQG